MNIGIIQSNFVVGDLYGNSEKIQDGYARLVASGAELVLCTELALTGYPPMDLLLEDEFIEEQTRVLDILAHYIGDVPLVVGGVEKHDEPGNKLYNSAFLIQNGEIVKVFRKQLLPTYDVFDEQRYFKPGLQDTFTYKGTNFRVLICEDIWGGLETKDGQLPYDGVLPVDRIVEELDDIVLVLNASPFYIGKQEIRHDLVKGIAQEKSVAIVYANQVGANTDIIFDGASFAVNEFGDLIAKADSFKEDFIVIDTESTDVVYVPDYSEEIMFESIRQALVMGVRDYCNKTGFSKVVIGVSGGVDSALTLAIAVEALGAENVIAVAMPSVYSSGHSVDDARQLAENFGVDSFYNIPIVKPHAAISTAVGNAIGFDALDGIPDENIQARTRMIYLMAFSNALNALLLTTGNKSEMSIGYCTLYGDMSGGLAVLADLYKTLVYGLSEYINGGEELIPWNSIRKEPSAELSENQKDSDTLPPYEVLDQILLDLVEERLSVDQLVGMGFNYDTVTWVKARLDRNEYKRRQAAPGLKVTAVAFGAGRQMPIAAVLSPSLKKQKS